MNETRIMGIDFGEVKVGIAISDPLKMIASPYKTINRKKTPNYIFEIEKIVKEKEVESIVVGYPLTMLGKKSKQTELTENFIKELRKSKFKVIENSLSTHIYGDYDHLTKFLIPIIKSNFKDQKNVVLQMKIFKGDRSNYAPSF